MTQRSPFVAGLRAVARTPSIWLAEIAWRWCFGIAASMLAFLSLFEFLRTLRVSEADELFLQSANPFLMAEALTDIFRGSGPRLVRVAAVLLPAVAVLWTFASALGRSATLRAMVPGRLGRFRSMLGLSFLRTSLVLAAVVCFGGAGVVGRMLVGTPSDDMSRATTQANAAILIALAIGLLVALAWAVLNWVLSIGPVYVALAGDDAVTAIGSVLGLFRRRAGQVIATSTWFGLVHLAAFVGVWVISMFPLALVGTSVWAAAAGMLLVMAAYFAVVDFLYLARLAAYVAIAEDDKSLEGVPSGPVAPEGPVPDATSVLLS